MNIKTNVKTAHQEAKNAKVYYYGTGRDKTSVARVFMSVSTAKAGKFTINGNRTLEEYFQRETFRMVVMQPLNVVNMVDHFDFKINVNGGGNSGQADAVRLGIARALVDYDESLKTSLRSGGFLTRDKRKVERKKCGLRKARKKEQYSKR